MQGDVDAITTLIVVMETSSLKMVAAQLYE